MPTLFLKHKVANYDAWRPAYDGHLSKRTEAGLKEIGVYRDAKDPNELLIAWTAADVGKARTFISSPDLKTRMKEAGVVSDPKFWFAE
jgi:hypothetical protein